MKSLTPDKALSGECGFMAANLYAKSIFGEDALANVSLEKNPAKPDATVTGHIRIRAKSQGKYTVGSVQGYRNRYDIIDHGHEKNTFCVFFSKIYIHRDRGICYHRFMEVSYKL